MPGTYVLTTITCRTIGSSSSPPARSPSSPSYQLVNTREELDQRASRACNYAHMAVDGVDVPTAAIIKEEVHRSAAGVSHALRPRRSAT